MAKKKKTNLMDNRRMPIRTKTQSKSTNKATKKRSKKNKTKNQVDYDAIYEKYFFPELDVLAKNIKIWRAQKGFKTNKSNVMEKLMLVVTELSEAAEAYRHDPKLKDKKISDNFKEEIADAFIRLFDLAGSLNLDISYTLAAKMTYNEGRPYLHGKKL